MPVYFFIGLFIISNAHAGWNPFKKDCLDALESASKTLTQCEIKKELPDDCAEEERQFENVMLQCEKEGFNPNKGDDKRRMKAAIKLGKNKIKGDPSKSTYSMVYKSLHNKHFWIEETDTNYLIFTSNCNKIENNKFWQMHSYIYRQDTLFVIFINLDEGCSDIDDLEEKFPILTEDQLSKLGQGKYTRSSSNKYDIHDRYTIDKLEVLRCWTYEAALMNYNELKNANR